MLDVAFLFLRDVRKDENRAEKIQDYLKRYTLIQLCLSLATDRVVQTLCTPVFSSGHGRHSGTYSMGHL